MNAVWCLPSMRTFGENVSRLLGWPLMVGGFVGDCDTVYIIGLYDPPYYTTTLDATARAKRRIIHWCGSDVLHLSRPSLMPEAVHLAETDGLVRELAEKGVDATRVMFPPRHHLQVTPLPKKPVVAAYLGSNPGAYGNDVLQAAAEILGDRFDFLGYMLGTYDDKTYPEMVAGATCCVRLTRHDGSANTAREFMEAGRRAVITGDLPYATKVRIDDLPGVISAIVKACTPTEPDTEAAAYWKAMNADARYLKELREVVDV